MDAILIVLLYDLMGELNSTTIGVVYLSFTNLISVACLIIRSRIPVLYGFGSVRLSLTEVNYFFSECSSEGDMVSLSFSVVVDVFTVFGCNF